MTRARRETEEGVGVDDPARRRALRNQPAASSQASPAAATSESWEYDATEVTPRPGAPAVVQAVEQATPTHIDGSGPREAPGTPPSNEQATPVYTYASGPSVAQPAVEQATPTHIDTSIPLSRATDAVIAQLPQAMDQATPTELMARPERSEPIRVISMKERAASQPRGDATPEPRVPLHVQLRSMAEVAGVHDRPGLGHLAPPHDPRRARARRRRDNVVWGCIAIALACGIALAIWLLAGR